MNKKINIPQKGAAKKWAEKLKEFRKDFPSKEFMEKFNKPEPKKKIAASPKSRKDAE
jgi:hypothetical protein